MQAETQLRRRERSSRTRSAAPFYGAPADARPQVVGKTDEARVRLLPEVSEFNPLMVARAFVARLGRLVPVPELERRLASLQARAADGSDTLFPRRKPYFCSGCASFFMLKSTGAEGKVLDPPDSNEGVGVVFDERDALAKAYSFFLDRPTTILFDQVGEGYMGREIEEGVFFGVDKRVLAAIQERPPDPAARRQRVAEVFTILADRAQAYESRRDRNASPGPDGTILVDRHRPPARRRRAPV